MSDSTYQGKVYSKQGGDELVVASGGKITVESGGTIDASAGTTTLKAGSVALTKINVVGIKCLAAAGRNGAAAVTLTGAAVGDRLVAVFGAPTAGGALEVKAPGNRLRSRDHCRRPDPAGVRGQPLGEHLRVHPHPGGGIA